MKKMIALVLSFSILLPPFAEAKPGSSSSSGGRSSGSSSGRSYSGSSSSSGRSSSSSSSSGKSYSGSSSKPAKTTTTPTTSGGKTYSGTSSKPATTTSTPSKTATTTSGSGKTYSGSNPSSPPPKTTSASGKSYSGTTTTNNSAKPKAPSFDSAALKEQKSADSKAAYRKSFDKGTTPKTEYTDSKGNSVKIDPKDKKIDSLRSQLDHQKWVNRDLRQENFYRSYYGSPGYVGFFPTGVYYHDPYQPVFFYWLWSQSLETRALWMYNHQASMDRARYNALLAKDAQLEARLRQMEAQKAVRDPSYTPTGVDPDLMYNSEYVDAVYNPTGQVPPTVVSDSGGGMGWVCFWFVVIIAVGVVVYFVFYHRF